MLTIGHSVTRPGRKFGDEPVTINVPEELETVPGVHENRTDADFYSREYPLVSPQSQQSGDTEWERSVWSREVVEFRRGWYMQNLPYVLAAKGSANLEPTANPVPGKDLTQQIKAKAGELGFGEAGITKLDRRYVYKDTSRLLKKGSKCRI